MASTDEYERDVIYPEGTEPPEGSIVRMAGGDPPQMIHLRNAHFVTSRGSPTGPGF